MSLNQSRWTKRVVALVAVLMLSALSSSAVADDGEQAPEGMSAEDLAERVQHFYRQTDDFQGGFLQTYTDVAAGETRRSRGRVYFKKPGMMRWDYYNTDSDERDRLLVSDGNKFWIYEFEYQQVFRQCLEDSQLPTTLRFLMGEGELLEEFDVSFSDASTAGKPQIDLVPSEPTSHYQKLEFVLDPDSFQVDKTTVYDPYGNTNEIDFRNVRVNQNLPDSGFEFEVPEGARELNPEKECK